jgi:hypothetical protein
MACETNADERLYGIRNIDAVRRASVDESGDRLVDDGEVDDEQRRPVRLREIVYGLQRTEVQNCPVKASICACGTPAANMRTDN